jgi:thioredoxin
MAIKYTKSEDIEKAVATGSTVLVDFWATWCPPCRAFGPVFEKSSESHPEAIYIKIDTDEDQSFAAANNISSIPTVWIYKNGEKIYDKPGSLLPAEIDELIS